MELKSIIPPLVSETLIKVVPRDITDEIINTEIDYVEKMELAIKLIEMFKKNFTDLPFTLRGHKYTLFGSMMKIYEIHKNNILPSLGKCRGDVEQLCKVLRKNLKINSFYFYILHHFCVPRARKVYEMNEKYFIVSYIV